MSAPGNFGLRRNPGRGNNRTKSKSAQPWVQVGKSVRSATSIAPDGEGPVPTNREKVSHKFTTYCTLALGHDRRKPPPSKVVLLRLLSNFLRSVDKTVAFLPYDATQDLNYICHASHFPTAPLELGHYCPEFVYYLKRYRTKVRIASEMPLWQIKSKIFQELRLNDFWLEPTVIKNKTSERCGFFLYAHPYMAQNRDFRNILSPILEKAWGVDERYEYDLMPEQLNSTVGESKFVTRVLMLRTSPHYTAKVQQTLSSIYAESSTTDLGTLERYKSVPLTSTTAVSDEMLQGLLRSQAVFTGNVFVYQCNNIHNIDYQYTFTYENESSDEQDREDGEVPEICVYSLRQWMYDIESSDGTSLIHAVYNTTNESQIKILCTHAKRYEVLEVLHQLPQYVQQLFPEEAQTKYLPDQTTNLYEVSKFPKVAPECETYAKELTKYTTGNPQSDEVLDVDATQNSGISKKCNSEGTQKTKSYATAATVAGGGATPSVLQQIQSNQTRLNALQTESGQTSTALSTLTSTVSDLSTKLESYDSALQSLADTQTTQGNLIETLTGKYASMESHILRLCKHFDVPLQDPQPQLTPQPDGGDVAMQDATSTTKTPITQPT